MNYFAPHTAAERYAIGRPYFHPIVIEHIQRYLNLQHLLDHVLDVACGTGLSTLALRPIARHILGVDASRAMLAQASADPQVNYCAVHAEALPTPAAQFDLITVSSALHWLDRATFLAEAYRVLQPDGWLVVYENYFAAQMDENPAFQSWCHECYGRRYPPPSRRYAEFTEADAAQAGFRLACREQYANRWTFSVATLIDYLMTHSNVINAVEFGNETSEAVRSWLSDGITPLFQGLDTATFVFHGPIWFLQSTATLTASC